MAKGKSDMWWEIKQPGKSWRPISLGGIFDLPSYMRQEMKIAMAEAAEHLLGEIKMGFQVAIRQGRGYRARSADYAKASPVVLMRRMLPALTHKIMGNQYIIRTFVFDMGYMDKATRGEGKKSYNRGWFLKFADGHEGRDHGSMKYGFCSLDKAKRLAEACIAMFELKPEEAAEFRSKIRRAFRGKHEEGDTEDGIMVKLDEPLFFDYPQFGKARKFVGPHRGYRSWPVMDNVTKHMQESPIIKQMVMDAITRALERLE